MKTKLLIISFIISFTGVYLFFSSKKLKDLEQASFSSSLIQSLPDFSVSDLQGNKQTLASFYGPSKKYLFLHFWGSWCGPCEKEFPQLIKLINENKNSAVSFLFVAISDKPVEIKKFLQKNPLPQEVVVLIDSDDLYLQKFGSAKVPETFVFGPDQKLIKHLVGPQDWLLPYFSDLLRNQLK